jgi:hypothetical protein
MELPNCSKNNAYIANIQDTIKNRVLHPLRGVPSRDDAAIPLIYVFLRWFKPYYQCYIQNRNPFIIIVFQKNALYLTN